MAYGPRDFFDSNDEGEKLRRFRLRSDRRLTQGERNQLKVVPGGRVESVTPPCKVILPGLGGMLVAVIHPITVDYEATFICGGGQGTARIPAVFSAVVAGHQKVKTMQLCLRLVVIVLVPRDCDVPGGPIGILSVQVHSIACLMKITGLPDGAEGGACIGHHKVMTVQMARVIIHLAMVEKNCRNSL